MKLNRKRYVSFQLHQDGQAVTLRQLNNAIWKSMLSLFGEVAVAEARFYLNEYDEAESVGYFQCNSSQLDNVIAAVVLLESIEHTKVCFRPIKTSGTIKALHRS